PPYHSPRLQAELLLWRLLPLLTGTVSNFPNCGKFHRCQWEGMDCVSGWIPSIGGWVGGSLARPRTLECTPTAVGLGVGKGPGQGESLVFVVDDDASVRLGLTGLLRSVGLNVEAFGSAADFFKKEWIADGVAAACLILDVRLPGVSGLDFQAELAKADTHLPIIFITACRDIPMTVRAMKAGAVEFLTKPFREQDLLDAVQLALQRDRD